MKTIIPLFAALVLFAASVHSTEIAVKSPDRKVVVTVTDDGGLSYSVSLDGREVVRKSRFGIISDGVDLGANVTLGKSSSRNIGESYAMFGGHSRAENDCRESTIAVRSAGGEAYELDVRAYNDGVALRARLAAKPNRKIDGEATEWKMAGNPLGWFQPNFEGGYEGTFQSTRLNDLPAGQKIPLPITFSLDGGGYALVTEANLLNYSDAGGQNSADHSLRVCFHAPPDRDGWTTSDESTHPRD